MTTNAADKIIEDEIKNRKKDLTNTSGPGEDKNPLMNRIEDKFFIPARNLSKLISGIKESLVEGDIDTFVRYNSNQTIYLDNRDLDSFKDNLERIKPRFKVRIRRYNPNGEGWEDVAYVELKIKEDDGYTDKIRIRIPESLIAMVCKGKEIKTNDALVKLNLDISKQELWRRVVAINSIISKYGFKKQVVVEYNRRAFSNSKIRITVDDSLRYTDFVAIDEDLAESIKNSDRWKDVQKPINSLHNNDKLILEVKYEDKIPDDIKELLEECESEEVKFSKYCAAVVTYINNYKKEAPIQRQKIDMDTQKIIDKLKSKSASVNSNNPFLNRVSDRLIKSKDFIRKASVENILRMFLARYTIKWDKPVITSEVDGYFGNPEAVEIFAKHGLRFGDIKELRNFLSKGRLAPLSDNDLSKVDNFAFSAKDLEKKLNDQTYSQSYKELEHKLEKGDLLLQAPIVVKFNDGSYWGYSGRKRAYIARKHGLAVLYYIVEQEEVKNGE